MVQLGGKFDPGGASTNDTDAEAIKRSVRYPDSQFQETTLEGQSLLATVEHMAVDHNTRHAEVIDLRSKGKDEGVVTELSRSQKLAALGVANR